MFGGVFAQSFLNVRGIFGAFEIDPAETKRAVDENECDNRRTREHKFSAGVDDFCAHAAPALDFWVVTDSDDLAVPNGHGLRPRLLGVFGIDPAVNDDHIRRFDDPALRARNRGDAEQKRERLKKQREVGEYSSAPVLKIRMLAEC